MHWLEKCIDDGNTRVGITKLSFLGYERNRRLPKRPRNGVLIASESGRHYLLGWIWPKKRNNFCFTNRGVYEGQIVGLRPLEGDCEVNVCKGKQFD